MKCKLIFFSFLMVSFSAIGQVRQVLKQNKFNSASFKNYEIEVKKKWFDSVKINVPGQVEFVDARADKSKLGFVRMGEDNSFFNLLFPEQSIKYINSKFQHIIKPANNESRLKIVIRHMWMSQLIVKASRYSLTGPKGYISFCYFKADYYHEKNGMVQFAGELDTVFSIHKWMGHAADDLMKKALITALNACDSLSSTNPNYAAKLLDDSLNNQFDYQILKTDAPKKGIYLSYEDFLNNNPKEGDFEVETDKEKTYLVSNATDTSITNAAWGYADDKEIYKHLNDSYYKMNRVQNTFELAGPRTIRKIYTTRQIIYKAVLGAFFNGLAGGGMGLFFMMTDEKIMRELIPYQLNIKEGTFY